MPHVRTFTTLVLSMWLGSATAWAGTDCCRVFMAADGAQNDQPAVGRTVITANPGETVTVDVWLTASGPPPQALVAYQLIWPNQASPTAGAVGTVDYVDNQPGDGGGDSIVVDTLRDDWVFAFSVPLEPIYCENCSDQALFGTIYNALPGVQVDITDPADVPIPGGPLYLVGFELQVSADACGVFEFPFNVGAGQDPRLAALFAPGGAEYVVSFQPLTVLVDCCGTPHEECDTPGVGCCTAICAVNCCANGVIDPGEDCDPPGECCDEECMYVPAGTVCAETDELCELPGVCDGESGECPGVDVIESCCGNGVIEPGEDCDTALACCSDTCTFEPAGSPCFLSDPCVAQAGCSGMSTACMAEIVIEECIDGDGCCPPGCTLADDGDSDCSICGDGQISGAEECDPPGACCTDSCQFAESGTECAPGDPENCLNTAVCTGSSSGCASNPVVQCLDGDGCCPPGCNESQDADCIPICGNGRVETGECCDDGNLDNADGCDEQCACETPAVPALSWWGMAVVVALLLFGVVWVWNLESEVRSQKSEIWNQESEVPNE